MNNGSRALIYFSIIAKEKGFKYKVAGDDAYSTRKMGQGKYIKISSCKKDIITYSITDLNNKVKIFQEKIPETF